VLIAAVIAPGGTPARLIAAWQSGAFELVVSPALLAELRRAFAYPKLERLVPAPEADAFVAWLGAAARIVVDPAGPPPVRCEDPDDDYLISLAAAERAALVSGDTHLTSLAGRIPVLTPAQFLAELEAPFRDP
jgi:putative PIN family toxin of toxin-antitoxin system